MSEGFPWYDIVDADSCLEQGDFIRECPLSVPRAELTNTGQEVLFDVQIFSNVIVMTQSCDLESGKVESILTCPVWTLTELAERDAKFRDRGHKKSLRRGFIQRHHLLNKCDCQEFGGDFLVVDFGNAHSVHVDFLTMLAKSQGKRLRLLPPYREHLAQRFGIFFMRIGLPIQVAEVA